MPVILIWTYIDARQERVFDLARSIDAHQNLADGTEERAVAGTTSGLIGPVESVTWRARHLGIQQELSVEITRFERPFRFQDAKLSGAFKRMVHDHEFPEQGPGTLMVDRFEFESPFGPSGGIVNRWILTGYMRKFLERRKSILKNLAQSEEWRKYLK